MSFCHEAKYYKTTLCMCGSVQASDSLLALELALPE